MSKIRFGIVGSGFMGRTHAEAVQKLPNATLIAVAGGSRAPGLAEGCGVALEASVEALLRRPDIDAVVITTPHHLHVDETVLGLAEGKHVLVEKPLALRREVAARLRDAAAQYAKAALADPV